MNCYVDGFLCPPSQGFRAIDEALWDCGDVHECLPNRLLTHPRVWIRLTACKRLAVASYFESDTDFEARWPYIIVYADRDPVVARIDDPCNVPRITASLISQAITRVCVKRRLDTKGYIEQLDTAKGYIEQTIFALAVYLSTCRYTILPAFFTNEDTWSIFGEDSFPGDYHRDPRGYETYPSAVFADLLARAGRLRYIGGRFVDSVPAITVSYQPSEDVARDFRQVVSQWKHECVSECTVGLASKKPKRSTRVRELLWNSYPHICGICGKQIDSFDEMHVDHVIPLSRGGKDILANLQLAHATCNLKKGSDMPETNDGKEETEL